MGTELPPELSVENDGDVRVVTFARADKYNAVNEGLHRGLADLWSRLAQDDRAKVVVLTGDGPAFCAGGDLDFLERISSDPTYRYAAMHEARRIVTELLAFPLPVIAAVNGPAVGLGCSVATLSDIVLIADTAYLADPHVTLGLVAADGGALCWPVLTSLLRAKELLFTGDRIDAAAAVQLGLANRVVSASQLREEALVLASRLADQPAQALRDTKRALNLHLRAAVSNVIDFAFSAESETFAGDDFRQRLSAMQQRGNKQ